MTPPDLAFADTDKLREPTLQDLQSQLVAIKQSLDVPFYQHWDFVITVALGIAGIWVAYLAYREAGSAKQAAIKAGRGVKIQTIAIELSEIAQRLDKLETGISYSDARDLLSEITRKLRRLVSSLPAEQGFTQKIAALIEALDAAKKALGDVRPEANEAGIIEENEVYFGIEGHFSTISGIVADLMGICETDALHEH